MEEGSDDDDEGGSHPLASGGGPEARDRHGRVRRRAIFSDGVSGLPAGDESDESSGEDDENDAGTEQLRGNGNGNSSGDEGMR